MMPARLDAVGASVPTDRSKRKASPYIPSFRRRPGSRRSFQVRTKGQNIVLRTSKILSGIRRARRYRRLLAPAPPPERTATASLTQPTPGSPPKGEKKAGQAPIRRKRGGAGKGVSVRVD